LKVIQEKVVWNSFRMKGASREGYRVYEGTLKQGDIFEKLQVYLY